MVRHTSRWNWAILFAASTTFFASGQLTGPVFGQMLDPAFAKMQMKEFGGLSMFVRADALTEFKRNAVNRLEFDACMIAAAGDPRTWSLTVSQAAVACLRFAAGK